MGELLSFGGKIAYHSSASVQGGAMRFLRSFLTLCVLFATAQHPTEHTGATTLRLAASVLVVLAFAAITPLAYLMPPDQIWIVGFYDNADYDDAVLAVIGTDSAAASGGSVFFAWTGMTALLSLPRPVSVTSHPRL